MMVSELLRQIAEMVLAGAGMKAPGFIAVSSAA